MTNSTRVWFGVMIILDVVLSDFHHDTIEGTNWLLLALVFEVLWLVVLFDNKEKV